MEEFLDTLQSIEFVVRVLRIQEATRLAISTKAKTSKEATDLAREILKSAGMLSILMDERRDALAKRKK